MLRAPLRAVDRRIDLDRMVDERSMELPRRNEDTMAEEIDMKEVLQLLKAQFSKGAISEQLLDGDRVGAFRSLELAKSLVN